MDTVKELAVAAWRLEKWIGNVQVERKVAAKSSLRAIKKYLSDKNIEVLDLTGSPFDPGLAVSVINNESDENDETKLIISEMVKPIILENGSVIQFGQVVLGTSVKVAKANKVKPDEKPAGADNNAKPVAGTESSKSVAAKVLAGVAAVLLVACIALGQKASSLEDQYNSLQIDYAAIQDNAADGSAEANQNADGFSAQAKGLLVYTVKPGDNLYSICEAADVEYSDIKEKLKRINDLDDPGMLYSGQELYIPVNSK